MINQIIRIFILVLLCNLYSTNYAQQRIYNFKRFSAAEGLQEEHVRDVKKDKSGLIWLATSKGLIQYDGIRFTSLRAPNISMDFGSISLDEKRQKIWLTTYNQGLVVYNRKSPVDSAFKIIDVQLKTDELVKKELYAVHVSQSGLVYYGGHETGLRVYNPDKNTHAEIILNVKIGKQTIFCIEEDSTGTIWIGTRYGGLFAYSPSTKNIQTINLGLQGENGVNAFAFINHAVYATYYDKDLIFIDGKTKQVKQERILNLSPNQQFYDNSINAIAYLHKENKLLIAHTSNGLFTYDLSTQQVEHIDWQHINPDGNVSGKIHAITATDEGYYFGSTYGLYYYGYQENQISNFIPAENDPIKTILKWKEEFIYLTESSIGIWDIEVKSKKSKTSLKGLRVSQVNNGSEGVYLSTYDAGVYLYDPQSNKLSALQILGNKHGFDRADCNTVIEDEIEGRRYLWIGSWNSGLYKYDVANKQIELFNKKNGLVDHKVITLGKDMLGRIWLGTDGFGAMVLEDSKGMKFRHFTFSNANNSINSNTVFKFFLDKDDNFWYSSAQSGLGKIKLKDGGYIFENFVDNNSSPRLYAKNIKQDRNGLVWMMTADGVVTYDPKGKHFTHLYAGEGIVPDIHYALKDFFLLDDEVFWMTNKGIVWGNLKQTKNTFNQDYIPIISQFRILNKNESHRLFDEKLILGPKENAFVFYFSSNHISKNQVFAYQLVGIDKDWLLADEYYQAHYTNIPGGHYEFKLKVGNGNGAWSTHEISIPIHIQTVWYESVPFKIFIVSALLALLFGFILYRLEQHKKLNKLQASFNDTLQLKLRENERMIKSQVTELEEQRKEKYELDFKKKLYESELKAIRSQMNPHFIFNVLNSIEAYVVENDADRASAMIQKFASLSRIVLENSQSPFVTLASEIKLVKLYLDLEHERFAYKFSYDIKWQNASYLKSKLIPSMLIQPIVENAIHHGIRHLEDRKGEILIYISEEDGKIIIQIRDNGNGFHPDKTQFKSKSSFGLLGVENRLNLINEKFPSPVANLRVSIEEVEGVNFTNVIITLPALDYDDSKL